MIFLEEFESYVADKYYGNRKWIVVDKCDNS